MDAAKRRFLLSHCFVRSVLTIYSPDTSEADWRFEHGDRGRPEVDWSGLPPTAGATGLRFNLSHTDSLYALIVTADAACGVDVETTSRSTDLVSVGRRSFASSEFAEFEQLEGADRRQRFFQYWTLKESYIKAIGTGLATPLRDFWFHLQHSDIEVTFAESLKDDPSRWTFGLHSPSANHQLAWALETEPDRPPPGVRFRWYSSSV